MVTDSHGKVVAADAVRPELMNQDWSNRAYFRQLLRSGAPVFSDVVPDGPLGSKVIVVAVPITGSQSEFRGTMAGMFRLGVTSVSAFYGGIVKLRLGQSGSTYVLDSSGIAIYHTDSEIVGDDLSSRAVARQALTRKVSELRTVDPGGQDLVASFAPVTDTPWVLVNEESWTALMSSSQPYRQFLLVLLALGVVLPALVVTVGVRRITGPIAQIIDGHQGGGLGQFWANHQR